jgi:hypothetical protein
VPFCGCGATCYAPFDGLEIICPKHYRLVDRGLKRLRRQATRAGKWGLVHLCWRRMRRQAIERAALAS